MEDFLISIDGQLTHEKLVRVVECLYLGYGDLDVFESYGLPLPLDESQKMKGTQKNILEKV